MTSEMVKTNHFPLYHISKHRATTHVHLPIASNVILARKRSLSSNVMFVSPLRNMLIFDTGRNLLFTLFKYGTPLESILHVLSLGALKVLSRYRQLLLLLKSAQFPPCRNFGAQQIPTPHHRHLLNNGLKRQLHEYLSYMLVSTVFFSKIKRF